MGESALAVAGGKRKLRAFFSAFNKDPGLAAFARALLDIPGEDWELEASTGTFKHLKDNGLPITNLADRVGEPMFDHRVVTLSREYHGGLLMADTPGDWEELARINAALSTEKQIRMIDLVYCDPYPFLEVLRNPASTPEQIRAAIDIGGSAMIRAAAKMGKIVVCKNAQRPLVLAWLRAGRPDAEEFLGLLAWEAFHWSAEYDLAIAKWLSKGKVSGLIGKRVRTLNYGENPHQPDAGLYVVDSEPFGMGRFEQIAGKAPSSTNMLDIDSGVAILRSVKMAYRKKGIPFEHLALSLKHTASAGAKMGDQPEVMVRDLVESEPLSVFGGTVIVTFPITREHADELRTHQFLEGKKRPLDGIAAPAVCEEALESFERKDNKCRVYIHEGLADEVIPFPERTRLMLEVAGGFLEMDANRYVLDLSIPEVEIIGPQPTESQIRDIILAWAIGSHSPSNTITLVKNGRLLGNGAGQQDRVGAAELAIWRARRAGHDLEGAVAYSDSFFPAPDGLEVLAAAGITCIFASSGALADKAVAAKALELGITLIRIPDAICRGFRKHVGAQ